MAAVTICRRRQWHPLWYSCLKNPMDGGAWWAAVHGVAKSWTQLTEFSFTFHFHALEKEMATHSSVFAWRIPRMAELGGLPSMGSHRVGHDWSDLAAAAVTICSDFGAKNKNKKVCHCFHCFPIYFPWSDGTGCPTLLTRPLNVSDLTPSSDAEDLKPPTQW